MTHLASANDEKKSKFTLRRRRPVPSRPLVPLLGLFLPLVCPFRSRVSGKIQTLNFRGRFGRRSYFRSRRNLMNGDRTASARPTSSKTNGPELLTSASNYADGILCLHARAKHASEDEVYLNGHFPHLRRGQPKQVRRYHYPNGIPSQHARKGHASELSRLISPEHFVHLCDIQHYRVSPWVGSGWPPSLPPSRRAVVLYYPSLLCTVQFRRARRDGRCTITTSNSIWRPTGPTGPSAVSVRRRRGASKGHKTGVAGPPHSNSDPSAAPPPVVCRLSLSTEHVTGLPSLPHLHPQNDNDITDVNRQTNPCTAAATATQPMPTTTPPTDRTTDGFEPFRHFRPSPPPPRDGRDRPSGQWARLSVRPAESGCPCPTMTRSVV